MSKDLHEYLKDLAKTAKIAQRALLDSYRMNSRPRTFGRKSSLSGCSSKEEYLSRTQGFGMAEFPTLTKQTLGPLV